MEMFSIHLTQDSLFSFFSEYDTLGKLQQKIWKATVWWCKKYPNAHPKQEKIAKYVGCRREHVNRSFRKFKELGWLYLTSRGPRRTKRIGIPSHLVLIDLYKREYFKRIEITSKRTHSYSIYRRGTSRASDLKKSLEIPFYLQKCLIPEQAKQKLSLVSQATFEETKYQCKKMSMAGFVPTNDVQYFLETAFGIAKQRGEKIDWRKYYAHQRVA